MTDTDRDARSLASSETTGDTPSRGGHSPLAARRPVGHLEPADRRHDGRRITDARTSTWFVIAGIPFLVVHATGVVGKLALTILGVAGVLVAIAGLVRHRPEPRWAWWSLLISGFFFSVGGAIRDAVDAVGDLSADRSYLPDLFTLPGYLVLISSLLAIARARGRPMHTAGVSFDAGIVGLGMLLVAWALFIDPALVTLDASNRARMLISIYPPLTVALAATTARLAFTRDDRTWSTRLLLLGTIAFVVGDTLFALAELHAIAAQDQVLDVPYGAAWMLFGAALLHPSIQRTATPTADAVDGFPRTRLALIGVTLLVPAVLFVSWTPSDTTSRRVVGALGVAMAAAVVVRVAVALDAQRRGQQRLARLAHYDDLTGLPNRTLIIERTEDLLASSRRAGTPLSLLYFDIDRFKMVNDTMGHAAGDALLAACARRVLDTVSPTALVGRLAGDEFVVVLPGTDGPEALHHAERLRSAFLAPVPFGSDQYVTISIGIATADGPDTDAAHLLRDADTALYLAKERGRDAVAAFDVSQRERQTRRLDVERRLRHAVDNGELAVHYQPVVSLPLGRIEAVEALVRWDSLDGPVTTSEFISVAEESGLIATIGRSMLDEACRQVAAWRTIPGFDHLGLSTNLSARELLHGNVTTLVRGALDASGLSPDALWLEITERVLIDDTTTVVQRLDELRRVGVHISIDDFGTGYSALAYLTRFPVEQVKIDRSFISEISVLSPGSRADSLVEAIIAMTRAMRLSVVAEGVETVDQAQRLVQLGCGRAQGFHFHRPLDDNDLGALLRTQVDVNP